MIHPNSQEAYQDIRENLTKRAKLIYGTFLEKDRAMTDREVKDILNFSDMNSVRPRITELIDSGFLTEVGSVRCRTTNKRVRQVKLTKFDSQDNNKNTQLRLI